MRNYVGGRQNTGGLLAKLPRQLEVDDSKGCAREQRLERHFDCIIVHKLDSFSRSLSEVIQNVVLLKKARVAGIGDHPRQMLAARP
jgi:hypothetical protein